MRNTQTPRTDAAETNWWSEDGLRSAFIVRAEFARELEREMNQLRKERDEARRMYCEAVNRHHVRLDAFGIAKNHGWNCYEKDNEKS
jgi:hypothetical protein